MLTGSMIRKIGVPGDTSPFASWTDAGAFSLCSHVPVNACSSAHYVCCVPSSYAGTLVSIDTATLQPGTGGGFTPIRVNAGGGAYTDSKGRTWSADAGFSGGLTWQEGLPVTGTDIPPVLQRARYGNLFTYSFPVPVGPRVVNPYFAEISEVAPRQRLFNVGINGTPVLTNFDVFAEAGGRLKAIVKSFPVTITGGMLQIQFSQGRANSAMVEALELFSNALVPRSGRRRAAVPGGLPAAGAG